MDTSVAKWSARSSFMQWSKVRSGLTHPRKASRYEYLASRGCVDVKTVRLILTKSPFSVPTARRTWVLTFFYECLTGVDISAFVRSQPLNTLTYTFLYYIHMYTTRTIKTVLECFLKLFYYKTCIYDSQIIMFNCMSHIIMLILFLFFKHADFFFF